MPTWSILRDDAVTVGLCFLPPVELPSSPLGQNSYEDREQGNGRLSLELFYDRASHPEASTLTKV
jgi:hypothetical protein